MNYPILLPFCNEAGVLQHEYVHSLGFDFVPSDPIIVVHRLPVSRQFLIQPRRTKISIGKSIHGKAKIGIFAGLSDFLKRLKPLRELILDCGITLTDDDISSITQHGESLEILAIGNSHQLDGLKILSVLEECHALRHLSIGAYNTFVSPDGTLDLPDDAFKQSIVGI